MTKPISVGVIRCDLHAAYYGILLDQHDPLVLRGPIESAGPTRDPWLDGGAHYYLYTDWTNPAHQTVPRVSGFQITKVWDKNPELAKRFSAVFLSRPKVCERFEDVSDDVDLLFIADCRGDGSDHLSLASPGLTKGVATFLDKPLAYSVKDAVALTELARRHNTPFLSRSMLSEVPQAGHFRSRLREIDPVEFGTVKGFARAGLAGHVHGISLALAIFGGGVESVECMGTAELAHVLLNYDSPPDRPAAGVVLNCDSGGGWHLSMYASAYSVHGAIHSSGISDFEFPFGAVEILKKVREMVHSRKSPISFAEMIEPIAIAEAARLAQKEHRRVAIKEVWNRK